MITKSLLNNLNFVNNDKLSKLLLELRKRSFPCLYQKNLEKRWMVSIISISLEILDWV